MDQVVSEELNKAQGRRDVTADQKRQQFRADLGETPPSKENASLKIAKNKLSLPKYFQGHSGKFRDIQGHSGIN